MGASDWDNFEFLVQDLQEPATPPKANLGHYTRYILYKKAQLAKKKYSVLRQTQSATVKMFKYLFALFALFAVAFAAPAANPNPAPPVITYGAIGYSSVPHVTTYSAYPHVSVPSYAAVPSAYVYGAAPVVYG